MTLLLQHQQEGDAQLWSGRSLFTPCCTAADTAAADAAVADTGGAAAVPETSAGGGNTAFAVRT